MSLRNDPMPAPLPNAFEESSPLTGLPDAFHPGHCFPNALLDELAAWARLPYDCRVAHHPGLNRREGTDPTPPKLQKRDSGAAHYGLDKINPSTLSRSESRAKCRGPRSWRDRVRRPPAAAGASDRSECHSASMLTQR